MIEWISNVFYTCELIQRRKLGLRIRVMPILSLCKLSPRYKNHLETGNLHNRSIPDIITVTMSALTLTGNSKLIRTRNITQVTLKTSKNYNPGFGV